MQPNNNAINNSVEKTTPASTPVSGSVEMLEKPAMTESPNNDVVFNDKPKKSHGMVIGMVLLALLAAGGIGFGVWAMMDGNQQKDALNSQISSLKKQINDLQDKINDGGDGGSGEISGNDNYKNAVLKPSASGQSYAINLMTYKMADGRQLSITVKDGKIDRCYVYKDGNYLEECSIDGVVGEIASVIKFQSPGQDVMNPGVGFIMEDGTVSYFLLADALENYNISIKGKIKIDGFVINAIDVNNIPTDPNVTGGFAETVFILNDGTFVSYDDSMLE